MGQTACLSTNGATCIAGSSSCPANFTATDCEGDPTPDGFSAGVIGKCCIPPFVPPTATCGTSSTPACCAGVTPPAPCPGIAPPSSTPPINFTNPLAFNTVEGLLGSLLGALQGIIVVLALVAIVIGAILYITSAGNDSRMTLAKGAITAAMIGLAIGIAAPSFLKEISTILGWADTSGAIPASTLTLTAIALRVLNFLLSIVGVLGIIMLVIGGIMYLTAAGDEDRIDTGKKIVTYSIVGIAVALAALIIVSQIAALFA